MREQRNDPKRLKDILQAIDTIAAGYLSHSSRHTQVSLSQRLPCICFIAYKVYKELQRIIALHGGINLSVDKVIDIAKTIPTIKLSLPYGDTERVKTLFLTEKHQRIKPLFDIKAILDKKQD